MEALRDPLEVGELAAIDKVIQLADGLDADEAAPSIVFVEHLILRARVAPLADNIRREEAREAQQEAVLVDAKLERR